MTAEPTNTDRADWARDALAVFTARTFSGDHPNSMHEDDLECAIGDLIADLLHYAEPQRFETDVIVSHVCLHFEAERRQERAPLYPAP